jgi:hypothetical protein
VRVFAAGTRRLLGLRIVDTGGGYDSQGVTPVHVALPSMDRVDVEVTTIQEGRRIVQREAGIDSRAWRGRVFIVRT